MKNPDTIYHRFKLILEKASDSMTIQTQARYVSFILKNQVIKLDATLNYEMWRSFKFPLQMQEFSEKIMNHKSWW